MPSPLSLAFVMDPIATVDIHADTSFALMLAAQERGHRIFYVDPHDLGVSEGQAVARVTEVTLQRVEGDHVQFGERQRVALDETMHAVFQRTDPPVDANYITATQILALCRRARVWNRPESVLASNEKLVALRFASCMPPTCVSRSAEELLAFMATVGDEMIVKPLDGKGGEGIFHTGRDDRNLSSIVEQITGFGTRWAMAQAYLPAVRQGDKRILLVDGEPLGALMRVPAEGETRANLHVGGRARKATIDEDDRRILTEVGPYLREHGLHFVGIDVIGGLLTEISVTSPTGIQEMNALDGARYDLQVIEHVEAQAQG